MSKWIVFFSVGKYKCVWKILSVCMKLGDFVSNEEIIQCGLKIGYVGKNVDRPLCCSNSYFGGQANFLLELCNRFFCHPVISKFC